LADAQEVAQTGLKPKRAYWHVFKIGGEEAYFVWPTRRDESSALISLCNDSVTPVHPLHADFANTPYCNAKAQFEKAKVTKTKALALAKVMNDALAFQSAAYYVDKTRRYRVFPNPHWNEVGEECQKPLTGLLSPWCKSYKSNKADVEQKEFVLFDDAATASEMAVTLASRYGVSSQ
jgi:hypothetical protein